MPLKLVETEVDLVVSLIDDKLGEWADSDPLSMDETTIVFMLTKLKVAFVQAKSNAALYAEHVTITTS